MNRRALLLLLGVWVTFAHTYVLADVEITPQSVARFRDAAERGDAAAQDMMGRIFSKGIVVVKDDAEAARWWQLAAEQDDTDAQASLGYSYAIGRGVPKNLVKAYA